tara:strand:+ start:260 stop:526 length:267 start_codon:yes stop_codon:yes gene_type:complete
MKRQTRSILQELNNLPLNRDTDHLVESTASNLIGSCINLIQMIHESYDPITANDLERRLINSIKTSDPKKFKRGIDKIVEAKRSSNAT